jgi:hypothetical protein
VLWSFRPLRSLQGYQAKAPLTRDGTPNLEHRGKSQSTLAGNDLRNMGPATAAILLNRDVITVGLELTHDTQKRA